MNILMIRLDKIGDLVCTLPVDQATFIQEHDVTWLIQDGMQFVINHAQPTRSYQIINKNQKRRSFFQILSLLKKQNFDIAISFQCPWWVHLALWLRRVPTRVGAYSQWHSFLFLNKGIRQKRSVSNQHEADYNFDLVRHAFDIKEKLPTPILNLVVHDDPQLLKKYFLTSKNYIVVHPGMAGSALNWPQEKYIQFIETQKNHFPVVITGTQADEKWINKIKNQFENDPRVLILQNQLNSSQLMQILKNAKYVIAPSTGVLHLAASLGTSIKGIFSPIKVHRPTRWGARGIGDIQHYLPQISCPQTHSCILDKCPHYNCMEKFDVTI